MAKMADSTGHQPFADVLPSLSAKTISNLPFRSDSPACFVSPPALLGVGAASCSLIGTPPGGSGTSDAPAAAP